MADSATYPARFETLTPLALEAAFAGGRLTSDGGLTRLPKIYLLGTSVNKGGRRSRDTKYSTPPRVARQAPPVPLLWAGSSTGHPSPSEADYALLGRLTFWTGGDPDRIARVFRQSGFHRPEKGEGYVERTVRNLLANYRGSFYDPKARAREARIARKNRASPPSL